MKTLLDSSNATPPIPDTSLPESVIVSIENDVAALTLGSESEPVVALTLRRMDSLDGAITTLESAAAEGKIRGLVVRGANPRMFCAGADLKLLHLVQDGDIPRIREALSSGKRLTEEEREKLDALTRENLHELAAHLSQEGMRIFRRLQKLPV